MLVKPKLTYLKHTQSLITTFLRTSILSLEFAEGMRKCRAREFGYLSEERCDRIVHCPDASDELDCPCSRLIPQNYKCDGYYDCPDFTDELACGGEYYVTLCDAV